MTNRETTNRRTRRGTRAFDWSLALLLVACGTSEHDLGDSTAITGSSAQTGGASGMTSTGGSAGLGGAIGTTSSTINGPGGSQGASGTAGSGGAGPMTRDASLDTSADASDERKEVLQDAPSPTLFPARVLFFYTPLGTVLGSWRPTAIASGGFSLSPILAPLERFKNRLLVVDGIDNLVHAGAPTSTDTSGPALLLTGQSLNDTMAGGESIGPFLARSTRNASAYPNVMLGVESTVPIDFSGPNLPEMPANNPMVMAQLLFPQRQDLAAQFPSTTDFMMTGREQMDLARLAFQYDLTRYLSLAWSDVHGAPVFNWIAGIDKDLKTLAANSGVAGADRDHYIAVQTWFAQQFAYLLDALANTPEGTGASVLDHTLVVWVSETGEASSHTGTNIPVVIAGNLLGRFRSGQYVQTHGSQAGLLSTIAAAAGATPDRFGDPALGNDSIAALLEP